MNFITTTNLRTHSSELINTLIKGDSVSLIHRSKLVAIIKPQSQPKALKKSDIQDLLSLAAEADLPKITYGIRCKLYHEHLNKKYVKNIS